MRIFAIRFTAVCFVLIGLWYFYLFIQGMITSTTNFAFALAAIILFRTGDNLLSFHEIGRKLAVGILGFHILQILLLSYLLLLQKEFGFTLHAFGASFQSDSKILYAAIFIPWLLIVVLLVLLLLQKGTRLLFQKKSAAGGVYG